MTQDADESFVQEASPQMLVRAVMREHASISDNKCDGVYEVVAEYLRSTCGVRAESFRSPPGVRLPFSPTQETEIRGVQCLTPF